MNTNMIALQFDGSPIRVVEIEGEPWFVGKDVAEQLGYVNATDALNKHCRGVAKRYPIVDTLGRTQEARMLSEPDVLRLIIGSKLPSAERFERWVFEEVLPQIRKTGSYGHPPSVDPIKALNDPATLRNLLGDYAGRVMDLESKVAEQAPVIAAYDRIANSNGFFSLTEAAKLVGHPPRKFNEALQAKGWIYRHPVGSTWTAYQEKIKSGYMTQKTMTITVNAQQEGKIHDRTIYQVMVTAKGLAKIAQMFGADLAPSQGVDNKRAAS